MKFFINLLIGLLVITSALHAESPGFGPGNHWTGASISNPFFTLEVGASNLLLFLKTPYGRVKVTQWPRENTGESSVFLQVKRIDNDSYTNNTVGDGMSIALLSADGKKKLFNFIYDENTAWNTYNNALYLMEDGRLLIYARSEDRSKDLTFGALGGRLPPNLDAINPFVSQPDGSFDVVRLFQSSAITNPIPMNATQPIRFRGTQFAPQRFVLLNTILYQDKINKQMYRSMQYIQLLPDQFPFVAEAIDARDLLIFAAGESVPPDKGPVKNPGGYVGRTSADKPDNAYEDVKSEPRERITNTDNVIYPNPGHDIVNMNLDENEEVIQVEIFDASGKAHSPSVEFQLRTLDIRQLPNGIYTYKISTAFRVYTGKFVKN